MSSKERNLINIVRVTAASAIIGSAVACGETNKKNYSEPTLEKPLFTRNLTAQEIEALQNNEAINYLKAVVKTPTETPTPVQVQEKTLSVAESTVPPIVDQVNSESPKQYTSELPKIFAEVESNPQLFNVPQDEEDLSIYYPIYRAAQDKFGVDWYTLWIIHQQESTVSRNPAAFEEGTMHFGAMQRSPQSHPQVDVDRYFQGFEYLNSIQTRNVTDPEEIIYAGASIAENTDITGSLLGALNKYSASGPAESRYERYLILKSVFIN